MTRSVERARPDAINPFNWLTVISLKSLGAVAAAMADSGEVASGARDAVAPASAPSLSTSRRLKPVDVSPNMNSLLIE